MRPKRRRLLIGTVVGLGVAVAVIAGVAFLRPGTGQGHAIALAELGHPHQVLRVSEPPGEPVVLSFWASWCVPCRQEMPALQAVHLQAGSAVRFVGIDSADTTNAAVAFVRRTGVTYPSGYDPSGTTTAAWGVFGLPTTVFLSASGAILARHVGAYTAPELRDELRQLFGLHLNQTNAAVVGSSLARA
jgi:thiol-disulfide isomerase/thioredoxin